MATIIANPGGFRTNPGEQRLWKVWAPDRDVPCYVFAPDEKSALGVIVNRTGYLDHLMIRATAKGPVYPDGYVGPDGYTKPERVMRLGSFSNPFYTANVTTEDLGPAPSVDKLATLWIETKCLD